MTALIVIGAIILGIIGYIVDEGGFLSKLALAALAVALGLLLLRWVTGWELMATLAKISACAVVLAVLVNIIGKIID